MGTISNKTNTTYCLPCRRNQEVAPHNSTMYAFPSSPSRRRKWLDKLEIPEDTPIFTSCRVCEHHFPPTQKLSMRLKKDALPSSPHRLPKRTYYQGSALPALKRGAAQLPASPLVPKLGSLTLQIPGQPSFQIKSEQDWASNPALTISDSPPAYSNNLTTYVVPALMYIQVDGKGAQKTTVVPQPQPIPGGTPTLTVGMGVLPQPQAPSSIPAGIVNVKLEGAGEVSSEEQK